MSETSVDTIIQKAKTAYESEDFQEAARLFEQASIELTQAGKPLDAAEMQNNRSVALLKAGKAAEALAAAQGTDQTFGAAGDVKRQAMALGNIASALEDLNRFDEAMQTYTQSADLFKQIGERELRAYVLERISGLQLRKGKRIESLATKEAAIASKDHLSLTDRILKGLLGIIHKLTGQK